jgi:hypothetical protein
MVAVGVTEIVAPDPTGAPPHEAEYQSQVAPAPKEPPTTARVVGPPQVTAGLAVAEVGAVENELTLTVTEAQAVVLHVPEAKT